MWLKKEEPKPKLKEGGGVGGGGCKILHVRHEKPEVCTRDENSSTMRHPLKPILPFLTRTFYTLPRSVSAEVRNERSDWALEFRKVAFLQGRCHIERTPTNMFDVEQDVLSRIGSAANVG